jgi:D-aspartate ligase
MKRPGAVVTGGDFQALGVIRSLGRKGIPVHILDHELSIGRFSCYSKRFTFAPSPSREEEYLRFLIDYAKRLNLEKWVIYPNNDQSVSLLSKHKKTLEEYYRIPTPGWETIKYVFNKKNTYQLAESLGIPTPKTYYPQDVYDVEKLDTAFPVVIKPATRDLFFEKFRKKAFLIQNKKHLLQIYNKVCGIINPSEVLIQEFIPVGPKHLYSFCPFFKEGKVVARIMARRSRQHPMDFGQATTFAESVYIPELEELGNKFLTKINYYGLAEVEFMFDTRDMQYKFLEVNARVWGWHTLAIGAGIDMPYLMFQDMTGQPMQIPTSWNNIKWLRLVTDIPTVINEMMKGRMSLKEYMLSLKGKKEFAVFSLADPLPFFTEILMIPYLWIKRGF